jgi:hypothetical protein
MTFSGVTYNHTYTDVVIQSDGKIVASILAATQNNWPYGIVSSLGRFDTNGVLDTGYTSNAGAVPLLVNYDAYTLQIQSDDKIFVGTGGQAVIKLNTDGTEEFRNTMGINGTVIKLKLQSDNKILVGGASTSGGRLRRYNNDLSLDTGFTVGSGFNNDVYAIDVDSDNEIIVGGDFTTFQGTSAVRIIKLSSTGSKITCIDSNSPIPTPTLPPSPTPSPTPTPYVGEEGKYMLARRLNNLIYRSDDYGNNFSSVSGFTGQTVSDFAISKTGQYQAISVKNGYIYLSSNSGVTFTANVSSGIDTYIAIAISSDGQYVSAITDTVGTRKLRYSSNFGSTWTSYSLIGESPTDVDVDNFGNSYISWRYGVQKYVPSPVSMSNLYYNTSSTFYNTVSVSENGDNIFVTRTAGTLRVSNNSGSTFNLINFPFGQSPSSVTTAEISRNGQYGRYNGTGNNLNYISADNGYSWVRNDRYGQTSLSYTGLIQATIANPTFGDDGIYLSKDFGKTYNLVFTLSGASWTKITINR